MGYLPWSRTSTPERPAGELASSCRCSVGLWARQTPVDLPSILGVFGFSLCIYDISKPLVEMHLDATKLVNVTKIVLA